MEGDQPVHRASFYRKGRQWTEQAAKEICALEKVFVLSVGEQWRMLHEDRHGQREGLALGPHRCHAPGEDGEILWLLRREKLDVLLLSDVDTSNSTRVTAALEEFVMIVGKMSTISHSFFLTRG